LVKFGISLFVCSTFIILSLESDSGAIDFGRIRSPQPFMSYPFPSFPLFLWLLTT